MPRPRPKKVAVAPARAPSPLPSPTPDAAAPPPPSAPSWEDVPITRRIPGFRAPRDYDAKSFEPLSYLARATKLAQRIVPDVRFIEFDAQGVLPDGRANLMLSRDFSVNYWFRSPRRSQRAPSMPIGVNDDMFCLVRVELSATGIEVINGFSNSQCTDHFRPAPRCSLAAVWARARQHGAPAGNAVAKISYLSLDGKWFFDIDGALTETIPDDCP